MDLIVRVTQFIRPHARRATVMLTVPFTHERLAKYEALNKAGGRFTLETGGMLDDQRRAIVCIENDEGDFEQRVASWEANAPATAKDALIAERVGVMLDEWTQEKWDLFVKSQQEPEDDQPPEDPSGQGASPGEVTEMAPQVSASVRRDMPATATRTEHTLGALAIGARFVSRPDDPATLAYRVLSHNCSKTHALDACGIEWAFDGMQTVWEVEWVPVPVAGLAPGEMTPGDRSILGDEFSEAMHPEQWRTDNTPGDDAIMN